MRYEPRFQPGEELVCVWLTPAHRECDYYGGSEVGWFAQVGHIGLLVATTGGELNPWALVLTDGRLGWFDARDFARLRDR